MPISTLYASPANITSDLFCAFQPKRVMVPSLPLRLGYPEIPRANFCGLAALARIALSVMLSTIPAPNIGVGMRKITFFWLSALEIGLRDVTAPRIRTAGDHEKVMDSAIRSSVQIADEPRFAHRAIGRDERRNFVCGAVRGSHGDLRIICRT